VFGSNINDEEFSSLKPIQLMAFISLEARGGTVMRLALAQVLVTGGIIGLKAAVHSHSASYKSRNLLKKF